MSAIKVGQKWAMAAQPTAVVVEVVEVTDTEITYRLPDGAPAKLTVDTFRKTAKALMSSKTVTITTPNFMDGRADLAADLRAIDPEIQLLGTAAFSGNHEWKAKVVELVIDGILVNAVKALVVDAIVKWAKKLFARQQDTEAVKIYGANNRDVLLLVERDKTDA